MDSVGFRHQSRQLRRARHELAALRRQLAAATAQTAAVLRSYDALPGLVFVFDLPSGSLHYCNHLAETTLGYPLAKLQNLGPRVLEALLPAAGAERLRQHFAQVAELPDGDQLPFEYPLPHRSGGPTRWLRVRSTPFARDAQGRVARVLGVGNAIIGLQQTQQALEEAKQTAEQTAQVRQQFLTNMSHEIRTPLNGIVGLTGLLTKTPLTTEQRHLLTHLQDSADNLLVLINDVLDMTQLGAGRMRLEQVPFVLTEVLRASCQALLPTATAKGIGLRLHPPPPATAGPAQVLGDPHRLRQVLLNLLGNAVKFTPKGQVLLTYQCLATTAATAEFQFSVLDTGIGIDPAQLRELFEPFTQASASTARQYGGSGLGLSISRSLVELLGGRLTAESQLGRGSTFRFTLPLIPAPAGPPPPPAPAPDYQQLRGYRVLLAEDNAVNQLLMQALLHGWGVVVDTASSGAEALALFRQHPYALVLMDIQMPDLDGVATTRLLRQHPQPGRAATPVVALTAHALPGDDERYRAAGLDAYLAKPFREEVLFELMRSLLLLAPATPTTPATAAPVPLPLALAQPPLYDLTPLHRLAGNDKAFVQRLVRLFIDTTPPAVARLEQALRLRQLPELAAAAHFLKSSTDGLQLLGIQLALRQLEAAPTPPDWSQLARLVEQVRVTVEEVIRRLRAQQAQ